MSLTRSRRIRGSFLTMLVLAALAAVPALAGAATTVTVNTTADLAPAPGACVGGAPCSLRQAVEIVNAESGNNRIVLPAGHYSLTILPTGGDDNETGDLNIDMNVTIEGAGARKSVIDASAIGDRSIELEDENLRLIGLGITGGHTAGESGGAGILQEGGNLRLERVAVTNNIAAEEGDGGGIERRRQPHHRQLDDLREQEQR